jgi:formylglycine-generating enzyme required for sulfatase activity
MRFAPVGNVLFSIWLTRVQDFEAFAEATGFKSDAWRNPGFKQAPDHPVVNVSWNDANLFCLWLTEKEHREGILAINETYRLPTDLEWSKAVGLPLESGRTPESRDMDIPDVYPWGTQWPPPPGAGNYTGEETESDVAIKGYNDGFAWTSPVGSFNVNKLGLYDMGGNVWQWCLDWWNSEQKAKVLRGGSWFNGALKLSLLSSCRIDASADHGTDNYGFRIVLAQEMSKEKSSKHHSQ